MTGTVFAAVLAAALLHAVWNALVKSGADKELSMLAVVIGQGLCGLAVLPFVPAPAPESWGFIAGSVMLHLGYQTFLMQSYRFGDLTQVYPIARGSAPILVGAVSVGFLGVVLAPAEMLGIAVIACGLMSLSLVRQGDGLRNRKAAVLALITGCFIASYSLVDGFGARAAGSVLAFYGWGCVFNTVLMTGAMHLARPGLVRRLPDAVPALCIGGGASFAAYATVVWAMTQVPIALVTALRETSIVFALLIGVGFLRERLNLGKVLATFVTLGGAVILRMGR